MSAVEEARIGPNAITRLAEALRACAIDPQPIFSAAGLEADLVTPPSTMVPEAHVSRLYGALHAHLPTDEACRVGFDAGERTGRYLLEHRIPQPAQMVLRLLPPGVSASLLLSLIERHAWTFAGSAKLTIERGRPVRLRFEGSPLCREVRAAVPVCDFYCGTFRCLFRALVSPGAEVRETACSAMGDEACMLEIAW